ncbi:hypothetical protein Plhal703r1_c68g0170251 [Plasmopara halstedii]
MCLKYDVWRCNRGSLTLATLQEAAKAQKEWAKYVAFDGEGRILFGNVKPLDGEITGFLKLFDKRECALASGCKFHIPLIYGRHGDPSLEEGKGILICKIMQGIARFSVLLLTCIQRCQRVQYRNQKNFAKLISFIVGVLTLNWAITCPIPVKDKQTVGYFY